MPAHSEACNVAIRAPATSTTHWSPRAGRYRHETTIGFCRTVRPVPDSGRRDLLAGPWRPTRAAAAARRADAAGTRPGDHRRRSDPAIESRPGAP